MQLNGFSKSLFVLSLAATSALAPVQGFAASACKGLEEMACKENASCRWIASYTTKNGNTVSAYCRSSGSKNEQGLNFKEEKGKPKGANDRADAGPVPITTLLEERNG